MSRQDEGLVRSFGQEMTSLLFAALAALGLALAGCAVGSPETTDDEPTPVIQPHATITGGGGQVTSDDGSRTLLYVAPTQPVGELRSPGYRLQLGPAAARSAR